MNPSPEEFRKLWVEGLRSGKYKQGKSRLQKNGLFCCLGVACELYNDNFDDKLNIIYNSLEEYFEYDGHFASLPIKVVEALKISDTMGIMSKGDSLVGYNDYFSYGFAKIADLIESNPPRLFKI